VSQRTNPPLRPAPFVVGRQYRVTAPLEVHGVKFEVGEVLEFAGEMHDVYDSCDVWTFKVAGSGRPKDIYGYGRFADPARWQTSFSPA
jgi:hypothetical protein